MIFYSRNSLTSRAITEQAIRLTSPLSQLTTAKARPLNLACFYYLLLFFFFFKQLLTFKPLSTTNSLRVDHTTILSLMPHNKEEMTAKDTRTFLFPLSLSLSLISRISKKKTKQDKLILRL